MKAIQAHPCNDLVCVLSCLPCNSHLVFEPTERTEYEHSKVENNLLRVHYIAQSPNHWINMVCTAHFNSTITSSSIVGAIFSLILLAIFSCSIVQISVFFHRVHQNHNTPFISFSLLFHIQTKSHTLKKTVAFDRPTCTSTAITVPFATNLYRNEFSSNVHIHSIPHRRTKQSRIFWKIHNICRGRMWFWKENGFFKWNKSFFKIKRKVPKKFSCFFSVKIS